MVFINEEDKNKILERYLEQFRKYGVDVRTLKSGGTDKQRIRHAVHASIGDLDHKVILDIGCGLADYYQFLIRKGLKTTYIGYDIVEPFIEVNQQRFPEATFKVRDMFKEGINEEVDYVIMSQVFNNRYRFTDNEEIVKQAMVGSLKAARIGISIDMMTKYVDYEEDRLYYFSPEKMFSFAKSLTKFVVLRHDYLPYEFTLCLYREHPVL